VINDGKGFLLIDQHALHERYTFEKLLVKLDSVGIEKQSLLIPLTMDLSPTQFTIYESYADVFSECGFECSDMGGRTVAIQAIPVIIKERNPAKFFELILQDLTEGGRTDDPLKKVKQVLERVACHGSIRAGQKLKAEEVKELLHFYRKDFRLSRCPHGRPTVLEFSLPEIEKLFGRK
jgi:DNA mismatch repair protein MutL